MAVYRPELYSNSPHQLGLLSTSPKPGALDQRGQHGARQGEGGDIPVDFSHLGGPASQPAQVLVSVLDNRDSCLMLYQLIHKFFNFGIVIFYSQKQTHRQRKQTYGYQRGRERGINQEIGFNIYTLLYIKQITNKDLLYSTGNSTQYSVMAYMVKESKKEWRYIYIYNRFTLLYT